VVNKEKVQGGKLMKYRVRYYGFVIVEAEDAQDALDKAQNDEEEYEEYEWEYAERFGEES
jgi:hypothetical protein